MARPKAFIRDTYSLEQNPFPALPIAQLGNSDERENGTLYDTAVIPKEYTQAIEKFVVGPVDSGSKFHFLWSLGEGEEARYAQVLAVMAAAKDNPKLKQVMIEAAKDAERHEQ